MMQLSGTKLGKMLKSLFREFISLKSLGPITLQKHMCVWKVKTINISCHIPEIIFISIDMDIPENDCPELSEKTADAIDDASLRELFVSTQMNNVGLCVIAGLR